MVYEPFNLIKTKYAIMEHIVITLCIVSDYLKF